MGRAAKSEWLWTLIQRSFTNYWNNANVEYFETKYNTKDKKTHREANRRCVKKRVSTWWCHWRRDLS